MKNTMKNKIERDRLIAQIELNKILKIKALSDRDEDKANMYQYAVQELQSVYHHILQPLCEQLAEKDKEIERFAIGFAKWIRENGYGYSKKFNLYQKSLINETIFFYEKELIELYKQSLNK